jgi:hypothetical protein
MPNAKPAKAAPADPKPGAGQQPHYVADEPVAEADSADAGRCAARPRRRAFR